MYTREARWGGLAEERGGLLRQVALGGRARERAGPDGKVRKAGKRKVHARKIKVRAEGGRAD